MRRVIIAAVTGLLCVGVAAAATLAFAAGVHSQTVTATRTPAVDLPTSTDTPAATITATATPVATKTATATPPSRTANQGERAGEDDGGNSQCQKHLTPSHGETGGNHCGQQKHGEDAAQTSDRSAMDDEPGSD